VAEDCASDSPPGAGVGTPIVVPSRKFCSACGAVWQPTWTDCVACARRAEMRAIPLRHEEPSAVGACLWLYFSLLAASAVGLIAGFAGTPGANLMIGLAFAHTALLAGWAVWARRKVVPALIKPFSPLWIPAALGAAVLTFLLAEGLIGGMHRAVGLRELHITDDLLNAGYGWPVVVLITCVQPAIFEELGFRGVILPSLQPMLAVREAVIVSALLFMTLHLTVASFPHLFVMGLAFGWLRVRTGSLVPGMLMHFTHNFLCILAEHHWG
jgi:membrane protease YdiL (CAAX protease family)